MNRLASSATQTGSRGRSESGCHKEEPVSPQQVSLPGKCMTPGSVDTISAFPAGTEAFSAAVRVKRDRLHLQQRPHASRLR